MDIFGRTRFEHHSTRMGGVGTWNRDCRSLFLFGFTRDPTIEAGKRRMRMEEEIRAAFERFGPVDSVYVLHKKLVRGKGVSGTG